MNFFNINVRFLCEKYKMSQNILANALDTSRQSLYSILETNNPTAKTILKISDIFHISCDDLLKKDLTKEQDK